MPEIEWRKSEIVWDVSYFIMLLSIFKFGYLPNEWITYLYRFIQFLSLFYLILVTIKNRYIDYKLISALVLYYLILSFSTLINRGDGIELAEEILTTMLIVLWMHQMVRRDSKRCLEMLFAAFEIIIYANLLSVVLYPEGLYHSDTLSIRYGWLLGHQSLFAMYASPAICVASLFYANSKNRSSKIRAVLLVIICVVQTLIFGSATNIACLIIISLGTLGLTIVRMKRFPLTALYFSVTALMLVVVVFQNTGFMEGFVVTVLNRTPTFTQRTFIWARVIDLIEKKWFIGYGVQSREMLNRLIGIEHAHNQYLQCLFLGGIPLLVSFLLICVRAFKSARWYIYALPGRVMVSAIASLLVQMIFEVYFHHTAGKYLILLAYYFPQLGAGVSNRELLKRV